MSFWTTGRRVVLPGLLLILSLGLGCSPYSKEFRDGSRYMALGDTDRGIVELNRAIEKHPDESIAYYNLGAAYFQKQQFPQAITTLDKFLALNKAHNPPTAPPASGGSNPSAAYEEYNRMVQADQAAKFGMRSGLGAAGAMMAAGPIIASSSEADNKRRDLEQTLTAPAIRIRAAASLGLAKSYQDAGQIPQAVVVYSDFIAFYQRLTPDQQHLENVQDMYRQAVENEKMLKAK
jgi:tetratricopeptide (TPR) repeat protein